MATAWVKDTSGELAGEICRAIGIDRPITALNLDFVAGGLARVRLEFILENDDTTKLMSILKRHREASGE